MYERILIAVDGSNTSELAMQEAVKLATGHASQLRIVHVVDVKMRFGEASDFARRSREGPSGVGKAGPAKGGCRDRSQCRNQSGNEVVGN